MTKTHFVMLAERLATVRPASNCTERMRQWENDLTVVAQACEIFNPRFDRIRFREHAAAFADQLDKQRKERE